MISKLSRFTSKINYNSFSYYSSLAANKCIKEVSESQVGEKVTVQVSKFNF